MHRKKRRMQLLQGSAIALVFAALQMQGVVQRIFLGLVIVPAAPRILPKTGSFV